MLKGNQSKHSLGTSITTLFLLTVFSLLAVGSRSVTADDRQFAKELVGYWKASGFNNDFELKPDGSYLRSGFKGTWSIQNGKLVVKTFLGTTTNTIALSPDGNTLEWDRATYKRRR